MFLALISSSVKMDIFRVFSPNLLRNPFRKMHVPKFLRRRKVKKSGLEAESLTDIHPDQADDNHNKKNKIKENWKKQKAKADQCQDPFDLHHFLSDYRDLVGWIPDMETVISSYELAKDVAGAEGPLVKYQEHKGEIKAHEDSFRMTAEAGQKLLESTHPAVDEVKENEKTSLLDLVEVRRIQYEQCTDLQLFYRDTEQADAWVSKQETFRANDNLGDSLGSVEALIKKHDDFEKNLVTHEEKIKALDEFAAKLMEGARYAADNVATCRDSDLIAANHYNKEDYGEDMTSVQNLQKKHALLEADVAARQDRTNGITQAADEFVVKGHFDADKALQDPMHACRHKLRDSLRLQQFFQDVEDEEGWIREKELIAESTNRGRDLIEVQTLIKKHQALNTELAGHEQRIVAVWGQGDEMIEEGHFAADDVEHKTHDLQDKWNNLMNKALKRKYDLDDSLQAQQYFADANEARIWMKQKEPIVGNSDHGKDEDSAELLEAEISSRDPEVEMLSGQKELGAGGDGKWDLPPSSFGWKNTMIKRKPVDPRLADRDIKNPEITARYNRRHNVQLLSMDRHNRLQDMLDQLNKKCPIDRSLEKSIQDELKKCVCNTRYHISKMEEGKYLFGEPQKVKLVRILRSKVLVRMGGGWMGLEEFLVKNDPCRANKKTIKLQYNRLAVPRRVTTTPTNGTTGCDKPTHQTSSLHSISSHLEHEVTQLRGAGNTEVEGGDRAIFKTTPGEWELFSDGRPFKTRGSILLLPTPTQSYSTLSKLDLASMDNGGWSSFKSFFTLRKCKCIIDLVHADENSFHSFPLISRSDTYTILTNDFI